VSGIRLLVCGGRHFLDRDRVFAALDRVDARHPIGVLIHGGARGADKLAAEWAARRGIPAEEYPAQWDLHGRGAGPIRNRQMLEEGRPHAVVAFPGNDHTAVLGVGTADMVGRAAAAALPVWRPYGDREIAG
jgi:hypothetical protein